MCGGRCEVGCHQVDSFPSSGLMSVTFTTWAFVFEQTLDTGFELGIECRCYCLVDGDRMVIVARAPSAFTHTDPV